MDRDKLLKDKENLLELLVKAECWAIDKGIDWESISDYEYKNEQQRDKFIEFANKRENIIKELEWIEEEMIKQGIIKGKVEGFEIAKATN
jgi:hypothetical protein